jgi:probable rRNA maturation factor
VNSVVIIDDEKWLSIDGFKEWETSLDNLLFATTKGVCNSRQSLSVNLLLTNDRYMQKLNNDFMGKNTATDILSFPQYEKFNLSVTDKISNEKLLLGDIAMSYETILRKFVKPSFFDKCSHLFVHGVLHLLGMEHENEDDANKMEIMEIKVLELFNLENPYATEIGKDIT